MIVHHHHASRVHYARLSYPTLDLQLILAGAFALLGISTLLGILLADSAMLDKSYSAANNSQSSFVSSAARLYNVVRNRY